MAEKWSPVKADDLIAWARKNETLLLEYFLGAKSSFVLTVFPDGELKLFPLTIDETQAEGLGVEPGPLTAEKAQRFLLADGRSLINRLSRATTAPDALQQLVAAAGVLLIRRIRAD